jgi:hypothetical protein
MAVPAILAWLRRSLISILSILVYDHVRGA